MLINSTKILNEEAFDDGTKRSVAVDDHSLRSCCNNCFLPMYFRHDVMTLSTIVYQKKERKLTYIQDVG